MAHAAETVADRRSEVKRLLKELVKGWIKDEPPERNRRLDGLEEVVSELREVMEDAAWDAALEHMTEEAEAVAGRCRVCNRKCERERKVVRTHTARRTLPVTVWRYRCRACRTNRAPVREWLGLQAGMTTGGLDRAITALSSELSFGRTAEQMLEHHGHDVDRTFVERRTYAVGHDAAAYLAERRAAGKDTMMNTEGRWPGTARVLVQVDSGAVPVGKLERPQPAPNNEPQERTPVRNLPKARRPKTKREVRVVLAWKQGTVDDKVVDVHVAPHGHPEFTGDRMYCAALEAGMGDATHVHGTFDMAQWQVTQFEEQFGAQPTYSVCADFFHTMEYIAGAAKGCVTEPGQVSAWTATQARRLKEGKRAEILADLSKHNCEAGSCSLTDADECAVVAARRYLTRNGQHMDYPRFLDEGLPIGSGEVEGRIRHIVRRRLDVPGDWREDNLSLITALITIRQSGWWDDFWEWRDKRDLQRFHDRLRGIGLNRFRGRPREATPSRHHATMN